MADLGVVGMAMASRATQETAEYRKYADRLERSLDVMQARQRSALAVLRDLKRLAKTNPEAALRILREEEAPTLKQRLRGKMAQQLTSFGRRIEDCTEEELNF